MCYIKFVDNNYMDINAVHDLIQYVTKPYHSIHNYYGGIGVSYASVDYAVNEFMAVKNTYHKATDKFRQMKHLIVSFEKHECKSANRALQFGYDISSYFGNRYQIIFAVHENTDYLHLHFAINTVSYIDGKMYNAGPFDTENLRRYITSITGFHCTYDYKNISLDEFD